MQFTEALANTRHISFCFTRVIREITHAAQSILKFSFMVSANFCLASSFGGPLKKIWFSFSGNCKSVEFYSVLHEHVHQHPHAPLMQNSKFFSKPLSTCSINVWSVFHKGAVRLRFFCVGALTFGSSSSHRTPLASGFSRKATLSMAPAKDNPASIIVLGKSSSRAVTISTRASTPPWLACFLIAKPTCDCCSLEMNEIELQWTTAF